jgi:hypothetical protein
MALNRRVFDETSGFYFKRSEAEALIADCVYARVGWDRVRRLSDEESRIARDKLAEARTLQEEVFGGAEVPGCKFIPPATTTYRAPWEALEEMCGPMMVRVCHWPRGSTGAVRATRIRRREVAATGQMEAA